MALCLVIAVVSVVLTRMVPVPGHPGGNSASATSGAAGTDPATGEGTGGQGSGGAAPDGDGATPDASAPPSPDPEPTAAPPPGPAGEDQPAPAQPAPAPAPPPANPPAGPPTTPPTSTAPSRPPGTSPAPSTPPAGSYEAEARTNTLTGAAKSVTCTGCSGGHKVGHLGGGTATLQFNGVQAAAAGATVVTLYYVNGGGSPRTARLSVDGAPAGSLTFPATRDWNTPGSVQLTVPLKAGANTLTLGDAADAPDIDRLTLG